MNLKQAEKFFDIMRSGKMKKTALIRIATSLTSNLWRHVFTDVLTSIYDVPDVATMRRLIKSGTYPPLSEYNDDYLRYMRTHALKTHGSIREHTHIDIINDKVLFYIPSMSTVRTRVVGSMRRDIDSWAGAGPYGTKVHVYNMGPIHERRKSILKSTIVFAWQDILKRVGNVYKSNTKRV